MDHPLIALLTDFGGRDFFVGSLKAVIAGINPLAKTIDITHDIPSFDRQAAGFVLDACCRLFPAGTIFLAVVDPGVGTNRKIILVRTARYFFLAPDNGLLTRPLAKEKIREIRNVSSARFFITARRTTFEGRDKMAPVAAWLSLGLDPREVGPRLDRYAVMDVPSLAIGRRTIRGAVVYVDKFGNLITNISGDRLAAFRKADPGARPILSIDGQIIRNFRRSYDSPKSGVPFALVNCLGLLEVAVSQGSAAEVLGASAGSPVGLLREGCR